MKKLLLLSYDDCIIFLKEKHGDVKGNYFIKNNEGKFVHNKKILKFQSDGLEIHHVLEKEEPGLSNPQKLNLDFHYQEAQNLVYCDLLEHFLLHLKIYDYYATNEKPEIGIKGAFLINNKIRDLFQNNQITTTKQKERIKECEIENGINV
nr:hypothetical protein [Candidatus Phytoplasma australiense]